MNKSSVSKNCGTCERSEQISHFVKGDGAPAPGGFFGITTKKNCGTCERSEQISHFAKGDGA